MITNIGNEGTLFRSRVVRVFVSSTFRDMQAERDLLVKKVFPELRERCRGRRVSFVEVDLRWGVTEEQAERGETLPVCLAEIENCRPFFIGLLGERYGWVPDRIDPELIERQPWLAEHRKHSITALEIIHGVLNNPEMATHAFFYFRDPAYLDRVSADLRKDLESEGPEAEEKLKALKERIRANGLPVREDYPNPESLAEYVLEDLWAVIDAQFPPVPELNSLDREMADHEAFADNRLGIYIGRPEYLKRLDEHINSDAPPLVLIGDSGSGKSALIANWAKTYREKHPSGFLFLHFIGSTPESSDYTRILQRMMGELKRRYDIPGEIPTESAQLCAEFPNWLSMASVKERFVLILDGLNQISERDNAPELGWLPEYFPPNVRVILSSLPGPSLEALKRRSYPMVRIESLTKDERKKLIKDYLLQHSKRLDGARTERIANSNRSDNPLFLRVLLDELKVFGIYEKLDERISHYLEADSIDDLYQKVLVRLEEDYEKERPGLVGDAMSLLWASRRGLSETELLALLNIPSAVWSPFYLAIKDFMVIRSGLFGFFHDYLRQAVEKKYLSQEHDRENSHRRLSSYFESSNEEERKVEEFPWQLWQGGDATGLEKALSDLDLSQAAWDKSQFDLHAYWAYLEGEAGLSKQNTYQKVLQEPMKYQYHLSWISDLFYITGASDALLKISKAHAELSRKSKDLKSLHGALNNLGLAQQALGNYAEALALFKEQEQTCRKIGDKDGLSMSLNNQGIIYYRWGIFDKAISLHKEQERILKELGNEKLLYSSLHNQATIHWARGNLEEALVLLKESERICRELGNKHGLSGCLATQGLIQWTWFNLDEALALYKEQEQISRELGDRDGIQLSLGNQGLIHYDSGNFEEAMAFHREQERICKELGNNYGLQLSYGNQALIHYDLGNLEEAMALQKEKERICRKLKDKDNLWRSLDAQALIYGDWGNLKEAIALLKEHEQICRELRNPSGLGYSFWHQALIWNAGYKNSEQALPLAKDALRLFRDVGMKREIKEVDKLIEKIVDKHVP